MSGTKGEGGLTIAGVPVGIVKGGTTSSSYDAELQRRKADADARRAHQDMDYATQATAAQQGVAARLGTMGLINRASPRLVLKYLARDKTVRQECLSELTMVPDAADPKKIDLMFTMVCPKCVARGVPQGESQMMIKDSHRKFTVDERKKGTLVMVEFHYGDGIVRKRPVIIAGEVTVNDIVKCDNYNCDYKCRIDKSNVIEV